MNRVILMGRLTREPELRYSQGENAIAIVHYTLAVNRGYRRGSEESEADFISCTAFRRNAEFAEQYLHQGSKVLVSGHIKTGSYVNKEGQKIYTTEVIVDEQEFAESRAAAMERRSGTSPGDFINIPDGVEDEALPFN